MGISPYEYKPETIINSLATFPQAQELYKQMGSLSASHFSNYPPVNQLFFLGAALFSGKSILGSVVFFRIIIILADIGIFIYGKKTLKHLNQNENKIFWYFLNPLVIIELTGNLHFEGLMLFFFLVGFYFLLKNNWFLASVFIAFSISVKLLPLLLLPLFWQYLVIKKSIFFYTSIVLLNVIFFIPFLSSNLIGHYFETISLWFVNFEFNASIYYIIRAIGFYCKGYNIIGTVGKILPVFIIITILFFAFIKKNTKENIFIHSLIVLSIYFFTATTVHPWYVINLVILSVFANYTFPLLWSFVIILSYYAYSVVPFKENLYLLFIEYIFVFALFFYELKKKPLKLIFNER
jgi:alpha-1,6-mannosyltransferase